MLVVPASPQGRALLPWLYLCLHLPRNTANLQACYYICHSIIFRGGASLRQGLQGQGSSDFIWAYCPIFLLTCEHDLRLHPDVLLGICDALMHTHTHASDGEEGFMLPRSCLDWVAFQSVPSQKAQQAVEAGCRHDVTCLKCMLDPFAMCDNPDQGLGHSPKIVPLAGRP